MPLPSLKNMSSRFLGGTRDILSELSIGTSQKKNILEGMSKRKTRELPEWQAIKPKTELPSLKTESIFGTKLPEWQAIKPTKEKTYKEPKDFIGQFKEGFELGVIQSVRSSFGNFLEAYGKKREKEISELQKLIPSTEKSFLFGDVEKNQQISKKGNEIAMAAAREISNRPELQSPEDLKPFFEGGAKDQRWWGRNMGQMLPYIMTNVAVSTVGGILGGPVGAYSGSFLTSYSLEKGSAYDNYKKEGIPEEQANTMADVYGLISASIENLIGVKPAKFAQQAFNKKAANVVYKSFKEWLLKELPKVGWDILKDAVGEGGEEVAQAITERLILKFVKEETPIFTEDLKEEFAGGLAGGLAFGVAKVEVPAITMEKDIDIKEMKEGEAVVVSADKYKEKFNDYDPVNHEKYSEMSKQLYEKSLREVPNQVVDFTAGGAGSGKSELIVSQITEDKFDGIIYDTVLQDYDSFIEKAELAKQAGKEVAIFAILPRIESAWKFVQKREIETGRTVPLDQFVKGHVGFIETIKNVIEKNPEISVYLKDTRGIFKKSEAKNAKYIIDTDKIFDILDKLVYNEDELINKLKDVKLSKKGKRKALAKKEAIKRKGIIPTTGKEIERGIEKKPKEIGRVAGRQRAGERVEVQPKIKKPISAKKIVGEKPSPFIRKREYTLLKERFKNLARGARTGVITTKQQIKAVQSELVDFIDKSELELKDKAKFRRVIKNIQTPEQLQSKLPEIQERIVGLAEASEIRNLKTDIKKELKGTAAKIVSGKPIGKFTPDVQRVLDATRKTSNLTQLQAEEKITSNLEKYKLKPMPPEIALQNRILSMSSKDTKGLRSLLGMIRKMKETGDVASSLRKFNIQEDLDRKKKYITDVVTDYKGIAKGRETVGRARMTWRKKMVQSLRTLGSDFVLSWPGLMSTLDWHTPVDKKTLSKKLSVIEQENKQKELQESYINDFNRMFAEIYDIPNQTTKDSSMLPLRIGDEIGKLKKEIDIGTFTNSVGTKIELKMTKDEMIKRYMEFKDPTLDQSFLKGNHYTNEIKNAITSALTKQEIQLANMQLKLYRKQHEKINPLYQEMFGVELPFNEFYSPIMREGYQVDTKQGFEILLDEANYRRGVTSKSFISRRKNILPIAKQGSLQALDRHITDTNYFIAWAKKVRELDNIFADPIVREAINQEFGNKLLREIQSSIDDIGFNRRTRGQLHGAVDWFRKKFTIGVLMLKPSLAAKQFTASLAYLEDVTPTEFASGFADFWKHPIKNYKTLAKESTYIRTRGTQGNIERDIKAAMKTEVYDRFSKVNSFINMGMINIMVGDIGSILTGSWIMRKAALKKGLSLSEVIKEYEEFGSATQQSADISRLTAFQKGGSLETLFSMFKSNPAQYLAKELNAVKSLFQKGGTTPKNIKKVAKTLFIYHILLPLVFQWVSNFGGWDDEDKEEYRRAMIFGSLNGLFIFGDMLDWALRKALSMRTYANEIPISQAIQDIGNVFSKIDLDDITAEDMKDALEEMVSASENFGVPIKYLRSIPKGIQRLLEQDWREGIGLMLGWSEYMLGMKRSRKKGGGIPGMPSLKMNDIMKKESLKMDLPSLKIQ